MYIALMFLCDEKCNNVDRLSGTIVVMYRLSKFRWISFVGDTVVMEVKYK